MRFLHRYLCAGVVALAVSLGFPATLAQASRPDAKLPTIFVVGDSTANNTANGALGWGDLFQAYFDATKVNVLNRARAGRSSRTFQTEGLWNAVLADLKPGDVVLIQFGHNDAGPINDDLRARGSLPGVGEETQEIDNLLTKKHEVIHTFGWYLRQMIADTRSKGATPIVLSLTVRNIWKDGRVERGPGKFGAWAADVAASQHVAFVDLTTLIADKYEALGEERVSALFGPDHTHTSPAGADLNASLVVAGLRRLEGCPLCAYLSTKSQAAAAESVPTVFLIGDSTVRNGQGDGAGGQWGWGEPLAAYFDADKISMVNRALGGTSSRTYLTGGSWDKVLALLKPGDYVIMQFGHNDGGPLNDDTRARGTIKGIGDETQEIDNLLTHQHEVVHSYGWYLRKFTADTRARGATPIVCSLVPRKIWADGRIARNAPDYAGWAAAVAAAEHAAFIDLNEIIAAQYDRLGPEKVEPLFADPRTHTSWAGAELNAASVIAGLKTLEKNPLAPYFSAKANGVAPAPAARSPQQELPRDWVDPDTGHRVVRLSDEPGSQSLYFHQNGYTPDGRRLFFTTPAGLATVDLKTRAVERVLAGPVNLIMVGRKTGQAYYTKSGTVFSVDIATKAVREIAKLPPRASVATVNADETLLAGTFADGTPPAAPAGRGDNYPGKGDMMEQRLAAHIPMRLFTLDIKTGEVRTIHRSTDWLNHLQFSPTDPALLMFCHEGPWHKVDRTWIIRTDGSGLTQIHHRTMNMEIEGHEFFSPDGRMIWYDLQTPRSEVFWVAGYEVATGKRTWYHLKQDEWSVHFNVSHDGKLFAGDGGGPSSVAAPDNGQWIYLFRPEMVRDRTDNQLPHSGDLVQPGVFKAEKLVNLARHNYALEPNVTFTPDGQWIVFRSNMLGPTHVFAVEVNKSQR